MIDRFGFLDDVTWKQWCRWELWWL